MSPIRVELGEEVAAPENDIVIKIDFDPTHESPARVFDRMAGIIRSLEDLDDVLIQSIDTKIETTFILEDLQRSSIKAFLRTVLKNVDDDALKDLDWKKQVGAYLVKAKYAAITWLDEGTPKEGNKQVSDLSEYIGLLAKETDVRRLPDYPSPNSTRLAQSLDKLQEEKAKFSKGEALTITLDKTEYSVDLSQTWLPSDYVDGHDEEQELSNEMDMILIIKKPDFLGNAQWHFKHGKSNITSPIEDDDWLNRFRAGEFPLKPGDALRVRMKFEYKYGDKGDLLEVKQKIVRVFGVEQGSSSFGSLFDT